MRQSACLVLNPITVYSYDFLFNCTTVHARIQEFSSGGVQVSQLSFFFSPQLILQKSNGQFKRNLSFFKVSGGSNIFQGCPTCSRGGVQLLIPYRNPYNLYFPGGSGPPVPPSGSALAVGQASDSMTALT